jgi:hypothetical protein
MAGLPTPSNVPIVLSEAQAQQIRAEEVFRDEIRKSLVPRETGGKKVLAFFNSALGIFLLSSVALTGATTWHAQHAAERQASTTRDEQQRRLDVEIAYRLTLLAPLTVSQFSFTELHNERGAMRGKVRRDPQIGDLAPYEPIFPEFLGRSLYALIWECRGNLPEDQRSPLDKATARSPPVV